LRERIAAHAIKEESVMFRHVAQRVVVAVAAVALLLGVTSVWAAENPGTVRGVVKSSSGQPLSGAYVKLFNPEKELTIMVISQSQGRFAAENLPPGKYTVQGIGNGFQSTPVPVSVASGQAVMADVSLTEPQPPALPNGWPARKGDVGGNEIWMHQPQTPLVAGEGKAIVESKCTQCHETERIILLRQNHAKWEMTVTRMRSYIGAAHLRQVSDEEAQTVVNYLARNYSGEPGTWNAWPNINSRLPRTLVKGAATKYFAVDFKLPEDPNRDPHDVTIDNKGNAWMPDRVGCCLNKFDPETYKVTTFTPPAGAVKSRLGGAIGRSSDGTVVWMQDNANRRWLSFNTATEKFTAYPIPPSITGPTGSNTVVVDGKGIVWGAGNENVLGLDPQTGKFVAYPIPYYVRTKKSAQGYGMAVSGDGKIWFAERDPSLIGRLDPSTGKIDEFQPPIPNSIPRRMGSDPAGNIWVGLHQAGKLVKIDYETTKMTVYDPPTQKSAPYSVVSDRKTGVIWFSEQAADKIARFDPKTHVFTEYAVPTAESDMRRIETDPTNPNRIWWSGDTSERVGYIQVQQ
jgi:streptogramin lyase